MKTVKQWLEELPEPIRTQAFENVEKQNRGDVLKNVLYHEFNLFKWALNTAFIWGNSNEGYEFWSKVSLSYIPVSSNTKQTTVQKDIQWTANINHMVETVHNNNIEAGWFSDITTGERIDRNIPEMMCLIHSEISEAMEGYRKNLMDDHLTHRKMEEVELADAVIRIFDLAGYRKFDLGGAIVEKLSYNKNRADHKIENRLKENGKKI